MGSWTEAAVAAAMLTVAVICWRNRRPLALVGWLAPVFAIAATVKIAAAFALSPAREIAVVTDVAVVASVVLVLRRLAAVARPRGNDLSNRVARLEADAADADAGRRRLEHALLVGRHGLFEIDFADRSIKVSEGFCELLGVTSSARGPFGVIADTIVRDDWCSFQACSRMLELGLARRAAGDFRFRHADDRLRWLHCRFDVAGRDASGRAQRVLVVASDVSERKSNEMRLQHMALHDALTGLGNRAAFMEHQTRPLPPGAALFLIDLDHFKAVNDRHGHAVGDAWLMEVGRRLREIVRHEDVVARIGGDEFAIVPAGRMNAAAVDELARRLIGRLEAPFWVDRSEIDVGASVGAARLPDSRGAETGFGLFTAADRALYQAKSAGRGRYCSAKPDDSDTSYERRRHHA